MIQQQNEINQHHAMIISIVPIGQPITCRTLHFSRRHDRVTLFPRGKPLHYFQSIHVQLDDAIDCSI